MPPAKLTKCRVCESEHDVDRGRCKPCMRVYDAEQKRKRVARRREALGDAAYKAHMRSKRKSRKRVAAKPAPKPRRVVQPYARVKPTPEPVTPVLTVGRRIPPAYADINERLACPEWVAFFTKEGLLDWARREAGR